MLIEAIHKKGGFRPTQKCGYLFADLNHLEDTDMLTAKENMREAIRGGNPDRL